MSKQSPLIIGRSKETDIILATLHLDENVSVYGPLYRGKTYLAHNIMDQLNKIGLTSIYFNCMDAYAERPFLELYGKQLIKRLSTKIKGLFEESQKYLPNIRPKMQMDAVHGVDIRIDYNISKKDIQQYIKEVIGVPHKIYADTNEKMIIVLDEWQALQQIKDINIIEMLFDTLKEGVSYLFLSSNSSCLKNALSKKCASKVELPDQVNLETIDNESLYKYIEETFQKNGIKATNNIIEKIIKITEGEISFIRKIVVKLVNKGKVFKRISLLDVSHAIHEIVHRYDDVFYMYFESLSAHQKNLIIAIAKEGGNQVFKGDFIYGNGLVSVPSVQTSISALIKKDFVHKEKRRFKITNFFFEEWLKHKFL